MKSMKIKKMALLLITALALTGCSQPGNEIGKNTEKTADKAAGQKKDKQGKAPTDESLSEKELEESTLPDEREMKKVVKESNTLEDMVVKLKEQGRLSDTSFAYVHVSFSKNSPAQQKPDITFYPMDDNYFAVHHKERVIYDEHKSDLSNRNWTRDMIIEEYGEVLPPISD